MCLVVGWVFCWGLFFLFLFHCKKNALVEAAVVGVVGGACAVVCCLLMDDDTGFVFFAVGEKRAL